jgi:hypothetical protein
MFFHTERTVVPASDKKHHKGRYIRNLAGIGTYKKAIYYIGLKNLRKNKTSS